MQQFYQDLIIGQQGEKTVGDYLTRQGATNLTYNNDKRYDIRYTTQERVEETLEVKTDRLFSQTGNVAIEIQSRGKKSGIITSQATRWVYKLGEQMHIVDTATLRANLRASYEAAKVKLITGGDDGTSLLLLVPVALFTAWCTQLV
jgi:hypothetical protein